MKNSVFTITLGADPILYHGYCQEERKFRLEPVCPPAGFFHREKNPTKQMLNASEGVLCICINSVRAALSSAPGTVGELVNPSPLHRGIGKVTLPVPFGICSYLWYQYAHDGPRW